MKTAPIDRRAVIAGLAGAATTLASPAWAQITDQDPDGMSHPKQTSSATSFSCNYNSA